MEVTQVTALKVDENGLVFKPETYISTIDNLESEYQNYIDSMLVCFTTGESDNKDFRTLRDNVVIDSLTYHRFVVPFVTDTLGKAREIFSLFDQKGYRDCSEFMEDIDQYVMDVSEIRANLETIVNMHVQVCAVGTYRQTTAEKVINALGLANKSRGEKIAKLNHQLQTGEDIKVLNAKLSELLSKSNPVIGAVIELIEGLFGIFSKSKEQKVEELETLTAEQQLNDFCLATISQNLLPAIKRYLKVMEFLLAVFRAMEVDAKAIQSECQNIKDKNGNRIRARIHFEQMQVKSSNLQNASLKLICFYDKANAKFLAMKACRGKLSYVGMWKEYMSKADMSLLQKILDMLKPNLRQAALTENMDKM